MELDAIEERYRSPVIFTPMLEPQQIDLVALQDAIGRWLGAAGVGGQVFGGGALLTGLTAQSHNAGELVAYLQSVLGDGIVASADEPRLESWVAFQGAAAALSRKDPQRPYLNLDIGGGTTNVAWGIGGEIQATGSVFVGARHVRVVPGSFTIVSLSPYAQAAFAELGIAKGPGQDLMRSDVDALLSFYQRLLAAVVDGVDPATLSAAARMHIQAPFSAPSADSVLACTFSGGVGALMHRLLQGERVGTTPFGDLGANLATCLLQEPRWRHALVPVPAEIAGRATSMGLMRHATMVSGSSIYLPVPHLLPLRDLPLLGAIGPETSAARLRELLVLCAASQRGGAMRVVLGTATAARVRSLGEAIAAGLRAVPLPKERPLVLLVDTDAGKALGHYATAFGSIAASVVVVDEIDASRGRFVRIGAPHQQVVPVSFFGMG
jgi:ethanolamine utilization protein EutA